MISWIDDIIQSEPVILIVLSFCIRRRGLSSFAGNRMDLFGIRYWWLLLGRECITFWWFDAWRRIFRWSF